MKSFGVWIATAALGAALVASGSAVAFEDGGQPELAAAAARVWL